jgi:hypothetical protein
MVLLLVSLCTPVFVVSHSVSSLRHSVILSISEGSKTLLPCHFVEPKALALLKRKRNGEIFAAGNGREAVKSAQPSSAPAALRGGKGNRHYGHRSHGTYVLTPLSPPKQCTVLFGNAVFVLPPLLWGKARLAPSLGTLHVGFFVVSKAHSALFRYATLRMTRRAYSDIMTTTSPL